MRPVFVSVLRRSCLPCMSCRLRTSSTASVEESACRGERALLKKRSVSSSRWRTGAERWCNPPQRRRCSGCPSASLRFERLLETTGARLLRAASRLRLNRHHLSVPNGVSDDAYRAECSAWCLSRSCQWLFGFRFLVVIFLFFSLPLGLKAF